MRRGCRTGVFPVPVGREGFTLSNVQLYVNDRFHIVGGRASFFGISFLTYLPHKAVAEVSKDKEPIGRECAEFNWFENQ